MGAFFNLDTLSFSNRSQLSQYSELISGCTGLATTAGATTWLSKINCPFIVLDRLKFNRSVYKLLSGKITNGSRKSSDCHWQFYVK